MPCEKSETCPHIDLAAYLEVEPWPEGREGDDRRRIARLSIRCVACGAECAFERVQHGGGMFEPGVSSDRREIRLPVRIEAPKRKPDIRRVKGWNLIKGENKRRGRGKAPRVKG